MRKKAPNGERLLRVFLVLEGLGGPEARFRYRDLFARYGEKWTDEFFAKWLRNGRVVRISRGLYRLAPSTAVEARSWLAGDGAEALRDAIAEETAERFRRDEAELEEAARIADIGSPWLVVRERLEADRRLRRTQLGRCILALRAAGGELSRWELRQKVGSVADITVWQAVKDGALIRTRVGFYDLPERAEAPIARNDIELVLLVLASLGTLSVLEIARAAGRPRDRIRENPVKRLRKRGQVERIGLGEYRLTAEGWRAAEAILLRNKGET